MNEITVFGPVRLIPHQTTEWSTHWAGTVKELMAGPEGRDLLNWMITGGRKPFPQGHLYHLLVETMLVAHQPQSWEGGAMTLRVGDTWPVRVGHLALVDITDGAVSQIRHFEAKGPSESPTR